MTCAGLIMKPPVWAGLWSPPPDSLPCLLLSPTDAALKQRRRCMLCSWPCQKMKEWVFLPCHFYIRALSAEHAYCVSFPCGLVCSVYLSPCEHLSPPPSSSLPPPPLKKKTKETSRLIRTRSHVNFVTNAQQGGGGEEEEEKRETETATDKICLLIMLFFFLQMSSV